MGSEDSSNSYGSSLTPVINIDCNLGDIVKFPLIGSFFKTVIYAISTPLLFVMFLIPLIVTLYISIYSCKTITFNTIHNIKEKMEKKSSYKIAIFIIVVCITWVQLYSFIKEEQYFAVLSIFLLILMISSYLMTTNHSFMLEGILEGMGIKKRNNLKSNTQDNTQAVSE